MNSDDVALAHRLAEVADSISRRWFQCEPTSHLKFDGTAVSEADLEIDRTLIGVLCEERPADDVLSEESGARGVGRPPDQSGLRRWILDPIDGTDPFLAGHRSWGTHVALEVDGELQIVVLTRPTEQRRWWAVKGQGAWTSRTSAPTSTDQPLVVSSTSTLAEARIAGFIDPSSALANVVGQHAHWVEDPLGPIVGLIEGRVDAVLSPGGAIWDHAPQLLLTTEAGGRYTDPTGGHRLDMGSALYTNGLLDQAIQSTPRLRQPDWATPTHDIPGL